MQEERTIIYFDLDGLNPELSNLDVAMQVLVQDALHNVLMEMLLKEPQGEGRAAVMDWLLAIKDGSDLLSRLDEQGSGLAAWAKLVAFLKTWNENASEDTGYDRFSLNLDKQARCGPDGDAHYRS